MALCVCTSIVRLPFNQPLRYRALAFGTRVELRVRAPSAPEGVRRGCGICTCLRLRAGRRYGPYAHSSAGLALDRYTRRQIRWIVFYDVLHEQAFAQRRACSLSVSRTWPASLCFMAWVRRTAGHHDPRDVGNTGSLGIDRSRFC